MAEIDPNGGMGRGFSDAASAKSRGVPSGRLALTGARGLLEVSLNGVAGALLPKKNIAEVPTMPVQTPGAIAPKTNTVI